MMNDRQFHERPRGKRVALILQGGGALGAYQVGVYQALEEHGLSPDWVAGTSIGAINGAIIAGNAPRDRLAKLQDFWRSISRTHFWDLWDGARMPDDARRFCSLCSVMQTVLAGQPGFFAPRAVNPITAELLGLDESTSFYDTSQLRATLRRVVDFDRINEASTRLSLGAMHVTSGNFVYFDNARQQLAVEHVMASGALPPGFPAVEVDGEPYWDGGIYSNTPLDVVLDDTPRADTLCFMVDLWNPVGPLPGSIAEVLTRYKGVLYASRSSRHIEAYRARHNLRRLVRELYRRLPEELRDDHELRALEHLGCHTTMNIVRLAYSGRAWELASADVDFSWSAIEERWARGYGDATRALQRAEWLKPVPWHTGVVVHELPPEHEAEDRPEPLPNLKRA